MFDKIGTSQWYWMLSLVIARKKNKDVVAEKTPQRKNGPHTALLPMQNRKHICVLGCYVPLTCYIELIYQFALKDQVL